MCARVCEAGGKATKIDLHLERPVCILEDATANDPRLPNPRDHLSNLVSPISLIASLAVCVPRLCARLDNTFSRVSGGAPDFLDGDRLLLTGILDWSLLWGLVLFGWLN